MGLTGFNKRRREMKIKNSVTPQPKVEVVTEQKVEVSNAKVEKPQNTVKKTGDKKVVENVRKEIN